MVGLDHNNNVVYSPPMVSTGAILNEREARDARGAVAEIERALSSGQFFGSIVAGLPPAVVDSYRRALGSERSELEESLGAYEQAKTGNFANLKQRAGNDPGIALVVARIARGLTQKDLARKLGVKEQQIQRYEAERYRSISLSNYRRVATVLGVKWEMKLSALESAWLGSGWDFASDVNATDVKKIIKHAKAHNWFEDDGSALEGEKSYNYLQRYVADHIANYGSPTFLRTGLNIDQNTNDLLLVSWKARITRLAEKAIDNHTVQYHALDISWLHDLVRLSILEDGPAHARKFLLDRGIVLAVEPQIPGLKLDGAAFLAGNVPIVGLTLRRDTLDNFWFTLLHELAHVILHHRTGLRTGFFDDIDATHVDGVEQEADDFASNLLIPDERWKRSPARISKSESVVRKFAEEIGIHPAIVFGRIQKERGDYATFSGEIGRGLVRKCLLNPK